MAISPFSSLDEASSVHRRALRRLFPFVIVQLVIESLLSSQSLVLVWQLECFQTSCKESYKAYTHVSDDYDGVIINIIRKTKHVLMAEHTQGCFGFVLG